MRRLLFLLLFLLVAELAGAQVFPPATIGVPYSGTATSTPTTTTLSKPSVCTWFTNDDSTNDLLVAVNGGSNYTVKPKEVLPFGCDDLFIVTSFTITRSTSNVAYRAGAEELP